MKPKRPTNLDPANWSGLTSAKRRDTVVAKPRRARPGTVPLAVVVLVVGAIVLRSQHSSSAHPVVSAASASGDQTTSAAAAGASGLSSGSRTGSAGGGAAGGAGGGNDAGASGAAGPAAGAAGGGLGGGSSAADAGTVARSDGPVPADAPLPDSGAVAAAPSTAAPTPDADTAATAPRQTKGAPPVAKPDVVTVAAGATVVISPAANDTDPDGDLDPSSLVIITKPQFSAVTVGANGTIAYTPGIIYRGTDTITYFICDRKQNCTGSIVTITVTDPPATTPPDSTIPTPTTVAAGPPPTATS